MLCRGVGRRTFTRIQPAQGLRCSVIEAIEEADHDAHANPQCSFDCFAVFFSVPIAAASRRMVCGPGEDVQRQSVLLS
jgi:hypothetical protein